MHAEVLPDFDFVLARIRMHHTTPSLAPAVPLIPHFLPNSVHLAGSIFRACRPSR
ncbi:hypothetical protein PENSPDRAFT_659227 [Peniophora sp. CONT]|nr:hypothetical protein PENSPDRAFT_659227 [Peniophora sp. CONT]